MLNVPLLLMLTRRQFLLSLFQVNGSEQTALGISSHRHTDPTMLLFLFFSPLSMLLFQPQWAPELPDNHRTFASARGAHRTPYESSSVLQGAQTPCCCG